MQEASAGQTVHAAFSTCGAQEAFFTVLQGEELLRDLLAIQVIVELNVAFCERHLVNCPESEQLQKECTHVSVDEFIVQRHMNVLRPTGSAIVLSSFVMLCPGDGFI